MRKLSGAVLAVAAVAATAGAGIASAQQTVVNAEIVNADRAQIAQKIVVGSTTFGDVLRIVGSPSITLGNGTINPAMLDADGDVLEDTFTTVSTTGAYTWSVGGTFSNGLAVGGSLTGTSGTLEIGNVTRFQLAEPVLRFYESDRDPDFRYWLLRANNSQIAMEAWDDNLSTVSRLWRGSRRPPTPADPLGAPGTVDTFELGPHVRNFWPETNSFSKLGDYNRRWLSLDVDVLRAQTFVVNETQAFTNGALLVSRGSNLTRDLSDSSIYIHVEHKGFRYHDFVVMRGLSTSGTPQAEWMKLDTGSYDCTEGDADETAGSPGANPPLHASCNGFDKNDYAYRVVRDQAGSGAFPWAKGSAVPSTDRYLDIYAFNDATITFGGAVIGDKAVGYWNFDDAPTTSFNAARSAGGDALLGSGANPNGGSFWPGTVGPGGTGAWYRPTGGGNGQLTQPINLPDLNLSQPGQKQDEAFACHGSVEMVAYIPAAGTISGLPYVDLVSKWDTASYASTTFIIRHYSPSGAVPGQIYLVGYRNGAITQLLSPVIAGWAHLVFTWGNHNGDHIYVNGVKVASAPPTTFCNTNNDNPIRVEGWTAPASSGSHIAELAVYAYDLEEEQVKAHYRALKTNRAGLHTGPTIAGFERQSDTNWYGVSPRWACGNLAGYFDYRRQSYGCAWGDYAGDWSAMDANGWRIMYQNTVKMSAQAGNLFLTGNLTIGSGGSIIGGNYVMNEQGLSVPVTTTDAVQNSFAHRWTGSAAGGDLYMQAYDYTGNARGLVVKNHVPATKQASILLESKTATSFQRASATVYASDVTNSSAFLTTAGNTTITHGYDMATGNGSLHATPDLNVDLGAPTNRWDELYFWPTTTTTNYPVLVLNTSTGQVLRKSNGYSGSCTTGTYENGILVSCP